MKYASKVIDGKGRGAKMGLATLNFRIPSSFLYPQGIYAGYVYVGTNAYRAAFHYGPIPTFSEDKSTLEAFILKGRIKISRGVSFELLRYLRPIKKFLSPDALVRQIRRDGRATEKLFA
jgi:FAD synthase